MSVDIKQKKVLLFGEPGDIHTNKWVQGWNKINYEVVVYGISGKKKNNKNVLFEQINSEGGNGLKYLKHLLKFRKILKNVGPDIINAHYLTSYGFIASLIKRKKDFMVVSVLGTDVMKTMNSNLIYHVLAMFTFWRANLIVSVSNTMTKKILSSFPGLKSKIITQQYGLDIELLDQFLKETKTIDILTNRQWKKNSNYEIIFEAIKNIKGNIIFSGRDENAYSSRLCEKYSHLNIDVRGLAQYEKNIDLVSKSKIYLSLVSSDGVSLSVLEAMYLGAIPVLSDIEPNREIVSDGVNGFIVPFDSNEIEKTLKYVLSLDKDKIRAIQEYNKNYILREHEMGAVFLNLKNSIT